MCNHIVQCRDKSIYLILHLVTSSAGLLSGTQPVNGPAGLASISLLLQAPCHIAFKRAELHLQTTEPLCLHQFDLQALNGLALSSDFQFKLLMAEQHPVVLQPTLWFKCLLSLLPNS